MKWTLFSLAAVALILCGFSMYWFAIRPSMIKHDCSWVKHHSNAIQARVGMTEDELRAKGMLKVCPTVPPRKFESDGVIPPLTNFDALGCILDNNHIIEANKPQKYVPAKDWYEKATPEEYQFCLHDKGL